MNSGSLSMSALKRVAKEIQQLQSQPPEGIRISYREENLCELEAFLLGPEGTPYAGGCFKIRIHITADYPQSPPKCHFVTKIFHPNVAPQSGEICVNTLKKDWKQDLGIGHILLTVKCLLIVPNAESALNEDAGKLLLEAYEDYAARAKLMTNIHAKNQRDLGMFRACENPATTPSTLESTSEGNASASVEQQQQEDTAAAEGTENCAPVSTSSGGPAPLKRTTAQLGLDAKKKLDAKKRSLKRL